MKLHAALPVLKGIEVDGDEVVLEDVFATCEVGADERGVGVEAEEDDVECGVGATEVDFGRFDGGRAVDGAVLDEVGEMAELVFELRPGFHVGEVGEGEGVVEQGHPGIGGRL